jgi:predicted DCC family thiol-disulfide oxidoreductase YuxK
VSNEELVALYDEDCGVCDHCVSWLETRVGNVRFVGMRGEAQASESLVVRSALREWHAEHAVAALLRRSHARSWRAVGVVLEWPGVRHVAKPTYRWVANHRSQISERLGWQACRVPQ